MFQIWNIYPGLLPHIKLSANDGEQRH